MAPGWSVLPAPGNATWAWLSEHLESGSVTNNVHQQQDSWQNGTVRG